MTLGLPFFISYGFASGLRMFVQLVHHRLLDHLAPVRARDLLLQVDAHLDALPQLPDEAHVHVGLEQRARDVAEDRVQDVLVDDRHEVEPLHRVLQLHAELGENHRRSPARSARSLPRAAARGLVQCVCVGDCPRALACEMGPASHGVRNGAAGWNHQRAASCCTSATVTSALPPHASSSTSRARSARGACAERTRGRGGRCREIASARPRRPPPLWLYSKGARAV